MTVTPEQIEGASFSMVKRGGYRTEEVDRFLRTLADEYRNLGARVKAAEGSNEDLNAASQEMATLMRDVHAQLGEKRRIAEAEVHEMMQRGEREAAALLAAAANQADEVRSKSDRVLSDAERHAELLRSDGEQRVREQAQQTLRAARAELQELVRQKHEVLRALTSVRTELADMESTLAAAAISPDAIDDNIVNRTLIDLREAPPAEAAAPPPPVQAEPPSAPPAASEPVTPEAAAPTPPTALPPPPPESRPAADTAHPAADSGHPAASATFFLPPDAEG